MTWTLKFIAGRDRISAVITEKSATIYRNGKEWYKREALKKEYTPEDVTPIDVMQFQMSSNVQISNMHIAYGESI